MNLMERTESDERDHEIAQLKRALAANRETLFDLMAKNTGLRFFKDDARAALENIERLGGASGEIARECLERWS